MPYILEGGGNNNCPPQMNKNPGGGTPGTTLGSNPALVTSSGGLFGNDSLLLVPYFNAVNNRYYIGYYDTTDYNCEEDAEYLFRQEDGIVGRDIIVSQVVLVYRNLGPVNVTFSLTAFSKIAQEFTTNISGITYLGTPAADGKLYTKRLDFGIVGERVETRIFRKAKAGILSIISLTLCGTIGEAEQR